MRARTLAVSAGLVLFVLVTLIAAMPARAQCEGGQVGEALKGTPAGGAVCSSPSPSPSPQPSQPAPSPTSTPTQQQPPQQPPPAFFTPPPQAFGPFTPGQPPNLADQYSKLQELQQQLLNRQQQQGADDFFNARIGTAPGLAGQPSGSGAGFLARAATLLVIATAVAMWMWRGRVRRWMIGA
jgi:hypothetical protein